MTDPAKVEWNTYGLAPPTPEEIKTMISGPGRRPTTDSAWVVKLSKLRAKSTPPQAPVQPPAQPQDLAPAPSTPIVTVKANDRETLISSLWEEVNDPLSTPTQRHNARLLITALEQYDKVDVSDPLLLRQQHKERVEQILLTYKDSTEALRMELKDPQVRNRVREIIASLDREESPK